MHPTNVFNGVPENLPTEVFDILAEAAGVRIERIISRGHSTEPGFWYDQDKSEWVLVLQGAAGLLFEGEREPVLLRAGDWLNIPAHKRHRVEWTEPEGVTLWLAVHY